MNIRDLITDADRSDFSSAALSEIINRIDQDDLESAKSIAQSCLIGLTFGTNSPEFHAHHAVETARLGALFGEL
jgi:hypothetical protein